MRITLILKSAVLMLFLILGGCDNNKASISSTVGDPSSAMIRSLTINGPTEVQAGHDVTLNALFTENSVVVTTAIFTWEQTAGTNVTLTENNAAMSFAAPDVFTDTDFAFLAEVTDAYGTLYDKTWIVNVKPQGISFINQVNTGNGQVGANSQSPQMVRSVNPDHKVTLTALAQSTGGGTVTYKWEQVGGTVVTIWDELSQTTGFDAPTTAGELVFKVTATDPVSGKSTSQIQKFSVKPPAIIAQAGVDHIVYNNHGPVKLNARVSGGTAPFTYAWSQTQGPTASLSSTTEASPTVTAPFVLLETIFTWQVVVTDANGLKVTTTHSIKVPGAPAAPSLPPVAPLTATINGVIGSAPIVVTEGDTVHPTVSIAGGTGPYTVNWTTAHVTINNPTSTTPNFVLPDITNTQGHDETLHLNVEVSDSSVDAQGKAVTVLATAVFTIKPAFIVSLHQNQQGSSGATGTAAANHHNIIVASQKNLHPVVDIAENAVSGGTYTYQWNIVKPTPAPSGLSIAGDDQLHPILSMPLVTVDTPLELSLVTTYTASSGKVYTANRTLQYIIEPPAAPSKQLLTLSTGGHMSVLSGHIVHPTVSVSNASATGTLTYAWVQKSGPTIVLNDDTTKAPNFTAPTVTGHKDVVLEVTVSDGTATKTAQVTYAIDPFVMPPLTPISVTASNDLTVVANTTVNPTATVLHSNGAFTYAWSRISGEPVILTGATTATPSFVVPNAAGKQVELEVTVTRTSDGSQATDTVIYTLQGAIEITAGNATQSIAEGSVLDLLASTKNAAGAVTYAWTVLDANGLTLPAITDADKSQASIALPAVVADTVIKIQVVATDTVNTVKSVINVTIKNRTLQVDAGTGYGVPPGQPAYLHGSVTGGLAPYTYAWVAIAATPANPTLTGASSSNPTLTAPAAAQSAHMQYELTVTDSLGNLAKGTVTISVLAPTFSVDAGEELVIIENAWGSLLAKADNNVGTVTYAWSIVSGTITGSMTDALSSNPWFQAPGAVPGTFEEVVFEVAATDATTNKTVKDQVKVKVQSVPDIFAAADATLIVKAGELVTLTGEATGLGTITELKWRPDSSNSHSIGKLFNATISDGSRKLSSTFNAPVVSQDTALYFNFTATGTGNVDIKRLKVVVVVNPNAVKTGPDRNAVVDQTVHLSAVAPAGSSFTWSQNTGFDVTLDDKNIATPSFVVPQRNLGETLTFLVTATGTSTTTDTVKITIGEPDVVIVVPNRLTLVESNVTKNPINVRLTYVDKTSRAVLTAINDVTHTVKFNNAPASAPTSAKFTMSSNFDRLIINPTGLTVGEYTIALSATALASTPLHDLKDGMANIFFSVVAPPTPAVPPLPKTIDLTANPDLSALPGTAQSFSLHVPTITGGTPPVKYAWSLGTNPHSITVTGADTDNPRVNFPAVPTTCTAIEGDITLTVSDAAGGKTTSTIHYKNNPAPQAIQPISCHKCRGPKFICERSHVSTACDASDLTPLAKAAGRTVADLQYCINDIENLKDGSRFVTRRCATADDVNKDSLEKFQTYNPSTPVVKTDINSTCGKYNVVVLQDAHFPCAFACKGDDCNLESVPDVTLGLKAGNGQGIELPVNLEPLPAKAGVCP